ncbi:hypothetical protein [Comamonas terrigena]|uniref:hypothetical protein n=1 Tax=Comamonas terrigena TaxID=32013 RepID=UPI0028978FE7|nr:hypothetical protein [Comamonas terrigena]
MVTQIDPISTPPTPADTPADFEQKASQVWADLFKAVPQMNDQAREVAELADATAAAEEAAQAGSDAAMGYRNEARAARDVAAGHAGSAAGDAAAANTAHVAADQAAVSAGSAAGRAEAAADAAEGVLADAVMRTSATGAAVLPEGPQAERPDPVPETGLLIRLNSTSGKPEWFNRVKVAWQPFGTDGGELFSYAWHNGPRASIAALTPGRIPTDGQQITLLQYPDAVAAVLAGKQNVVTEAMWQADATKRNCWSSGDGASWVRVPDLNAVQAGTGKPFYLRGGPDALNGTSIGDAIREMTGSMTGSNGIGVCIGATGVFQRSPISKGWRNAGQADPNGYDFEFRASAQVPTADENRVKTAYGVMTVRIFTEAANAGSVDAATLATQLAVVDAKVQALDAATGFTILYPNGGTAAAPANVAVNTRYVMPNPFPGSHVLCIAEVQVGGVWGSSGYLSVNSGGVQYIYFTSAQQLGDSVVLTTGQNGLLGRWSQSGGAHSNTGDITTSLPCRIKVWKLKGAM